MQETVSVPETKNCGNIYRTIRVFHVFSHVFSDILFDIFYLLCPLPKDNPQTKKIEE